jgi:ribosomal protein L14
LSVNEQVRETLASVGDRIAVEVRSASSKFAHVANAVVVAVDLQRIGDRWAVVDGVRATVAVGVDGWDCDCDGVEKAPRDA